MTFTRFFGDGEHAFALTYELAIELERKTGVGIGGLFHRVRKLDFAITDLTETIRLALIGGGMEPKDAFELTQAYVARRPIAESFPLVLSILESVWFGAPTNTQGR